MVAASTSTRSLGPVEAVRPVKGCSAIKSDASCHSYGTAQWERPAATAAATSTGTRRGLRCTASRYEWSGQWSWSSCARHGWRARCRWLPWLRRPRRLGRAARARHGRPVRRRGSCACGVVGAGAGASVPCSSSRRCAMAGRGRSTAGRRAAGCWLRGAWWGLGSVWPA